MVMPTAFLTLALCFAWIDVRWPVPEFLFFASATSLMAMALPGFALHWFVVRRLRLAHAPVWELLGRPNVVYYGSFASGRTVMRFFRHGEFEELDDEPLARVCRLYRVFVSVYSGLFALMLAAFCAIAVRGS